MVIDRIARAVVIAASLALLPRQAEGQEPLAAGAISISVRDSLGRSIAGAELTVEGTAVRGVTDERGELRFTAVRGGPATLRIRRLGFQPVTLDVVDLSAPVIAGITGTPAALFPPNNDMVNVALTVSVSDNCGNVSSRIVDVLKNGGNAGGDAVITGALTAQLRAINSNKSSPVVYTLVVESTDPAGNRTTGSVDLPVEKADKKPKGK